MSLRINHNIASINGHRNMMKNDSAISASLEKLSSGLRINKAADDAAGLVISEQMRAQITGLNQAIDNSETAISMVQTAEGALDEVNSLLNKARELVIHAANEGTNDTAQLEADQAELDNVISSITRIGDFTQFGTKKLLDGSLDGVASMDSEFSRINVGNLANNTAVNTGDFTVNVAETAKGYTLASAGTATTISDMFESATGISDLDDLTTSTTVATGTKLTISISGVGTFTGTATSGADTVGDLVSQINTAIAAASGAVSVSVGTGGGIRVDRTDVSADAVNMTVAFSFAGEVNPDNSGFDASSTAVLADNDTAVTNIFGLGDLANLTGSTAMNGSGTVRVNFIDDNGVAVTGNVAFTSTGTFQDVLDDIETVLQGLSGFGSATVSYAVTGTQLSITVDAGAEAYGTGTTAIAGTTLQLTFDNTNVLTNDSSIESADLSSVTASQAADLAASSTGTTTGWDSSTTMAGGTTFTFTVDGVEYDVTVASGDTLGNVATGLQDALGAGFHVEFISGGANLSGAAGTGFNLGATDGLSGDSTNNAGEFVIANTNGVTVDLTDLRIDAVVLTGGDIDAGGVTNNVNVGSVQDATLNLVTTSNSDSSGQVTEVIADLSAGSLVSSTGSMTQVLGDESINATLTSTANTGLSLSLTLNTDNSDTSVYTLDLADVSGNAAYSDIRFELDAAAVEAAMLSGDTFNFEVDNGAEFQVGANAGQQVGVSIQAISASELGRNVEDSGTLTSLESLLSTNESALTTDKTQEALAVIDAAIDEVTVLRGDLGAFQANTLETGLNSLMVSQENLTAAESTIRDVDFAAESANFTRNNIMIQASTAMLAQANQLPQNVLQLLG